MTLWGEGPPCWFPPSVLCPDSDLRHSQLPIPVLDSASCVGLIQDTQVLKCPLAILGCWAGDTSGKGFILRQVVSTAESQLPYQ